MQAVREEFSTEVADDRNLKKVEKTFEKPLDKRKEMWYNNRVAPREDLRRGERDRSLKIEQQQEYKAYLMCETNSTILYKE